MKFGSEGSIIQAGGDGGAGHVASTNFIAGGANFFRAYLGHDNHINNKGLQHFYCNPLILLVGTE